jgi:hypothetical protein
MCPCCKISEETTKHYMQCNLNPHTTDELKDGLKPIFDKHDVDPVLRILITLATNHQPISVETLETMHPILDFEPYYDLIQEQEEIGWKQLLLGRYGITWDRCQRRYLENKYQKNITGEPKWIRNIIRETWRYQKARWKSRNEELHGTTTGKSSSAATKLALYTRIKALYSHEMTLLVQDRTPFNIEIADWEHKSGAAMRQWLAHNTPHIKHALTIAKKQLKKNASDIRRFIPNAPPSKKTRTKPKQRRTVAHAQDTRQNPQGPTRGRINPPNPQQARIKFPKQYKQATLFAYVETRIQQQTAPTTQNT